MPLHELGFVPFYELGTVELEAGEAREVSFPDGSRLTFRSIRDDYDPTDRFGAHRAVHEARQRNEFLTGLLYLESGKATVHDFLHLVDEPVATLPSAQVKPGPEVLQACMEALR
jgi:2-oxoglutarate/2-oxoacid ferredoxin oxidoreductase subunit beta